MKSIEERLADVERREAAAAEREAAYAELYGAAARLRDEVAARERAVEDRERRANHVDQLEGQLAALRDEHQRDRNAWQNELTAERTKTRRVLDEIVRQVQAMA